ncbi:MAG: hypothetical protein H7249_18335 [Chitinophagaceae bacterium]|nr:hypothetical protein [Oligoflexus sp.]
MRKTIALFWVSVLGLTSASSGFAAGATQTAPVPSTTKAEGQVPVKAPGSETAGPKAERVSGLYKLAHIEKKPDNEYVLHFEAQAKDGVHDQLVLNSDGLNVKVEEGQVIKLSAEVLTGSAKEHEITQVLLFLPSQDYGLTPVWVLSKSHETHEIRGARWLEMHAPQADYQVM